MFFKKIEIEPTKNSNIKGEIMSKEPVKHEGIAKEAPIM